MQSSVAAEIEWRLSLYRNILDFCREGQFTLGRFLALVPSRLRLAVGESAAKTRIPVAISGKLVDHWKHLLPNRETIPAVFRDEADLRRAIRFSQIDSDVDPVAAAGWLGKFGSRFIGDAGTVYLKGFGEIGTGEGGEETAYLVHLMIAESFRRAASDSGPDARMRQTLAPQILQLAVQALMESGAVDSDSLPARLGFQFAVTVSPLSTGITAQELLKSPVNPYRTNASAVELAEKLLPTAVENTGLEELRGLLAKKLLADPAQKAIMCRDLLAEAVRDILILVLLQNWNGPLKDTVAPGRKAAASGEFLLRCLTETSPRSQFHGWVMKAAPSAGKAFTVLEMLVAKAPQILAGGTEPLGRAGDLAARAQLVAAGAIVMVLDGRIERMKQDFLALVEFIPGAEQEQLWKSGECYRIDLSQEPLYLIPEFRQEAHLFVDLKDFTKRTASIKEASMGDFLRRYFYTPIFELARRLQDGDPQSLAISNIVGDAVGFRGSIAPMVSLALGIREILKNAATELEKDLPEFLGGKPEVLEEIEQEIASWQRRIDEIDGALKSAAPGTPHFEHLTQAKKSLREKLAELESAREDVRSETVGFGLEAGAYVAFGAAAEVVNLSQAALGLAAPAINEAAGYTSVTIAERLNEAARGTSRSGILRTERELRVARARKDRNSNRATLPFQVSVGKSYQMDVPVPLGDAVAAAISAGDTRSATEAVQQLSRWFHTDVQKQVSARTDLPGSLGRSAEFYNAGCALSQTALDAYRQATEAEYDFTQHRLEQPELPDAFLDRWVFEYGTETFITVTRKAGGGLVYILRYSGAAAFKGFEKEGGIGVWEILPAGLPFCRDLIQYLGKSGRAA